jgi:hypothetical protein
MTMQPGVENRLSRRYAVRLSAEVVHGSRKFTGTTRDLSLGGVCLESMQSVGEGELLAMALFLVVDDVEDPSQPPLEVKCRVAWSAPAEEGRPGVMGLRFEGISPPQLAGLTRFLKLLPQAT